MKTTTKLHVHSIFESISGETGFFAQGTWCTFIRLQGCNLQCAWCDTPEARPLKGHKVMTIEQIANECQTESILITGGEPLLQRPALDELLMFLIFKREHKVQIETNGSIPVSGVNLGWVIDYKLPSSGMTAYMHKGFDDPVTRLLLQRGDAMVKFVIDPNYKTEDGSLIDMCKLLERTHWMTPWYPGKYIISPVNADGSCIQKIVWQVKREQPAILDKIIFSVQLHKMLKMP